jgi:tetratricopeptide (TPR) repeat protein
MHTWNHASYLAAMAHIGRLTDRGQTHLAADVSRQLLDSAVTAGETAYVEAPFDLAGAYFQRGRVLQTIGAPEDALIPLREAERRFRRLTSRNPHVERMVLVVLVDIGDCLRDLNRLDEAAELYARVIHHHHSQKRVQDAAIVTIQLGLVRARQQRHAAAIEAIVEARETFMRLKEPAAVAEAWCHQGTVYQQAVQMDQAEEAYRQGMRIAAQEHLVALNGFILGQLGTLYAVIGRLEDAAALLQQATDVLERVGSRDAAASCRRQLIETLSQLNR